MYIFISDEMEQILFTRGHDEIERKLRLRACEVRAAHCICVCFLTI